MSHVRYIDKTREYYRAEGYDRAYEWAHFETIPFTSFATLGKPLSRCRVGLVSSGDVVRRDMEPPADDPRRLVYALPADLPADRFLSRKAAYDRYATTLEDVDSFLPLTHLHRLANDGIIGPFHDRREARTVAFRVLPRRDVARDLRDTDDRPVVANRRSGDRHVDPGPILVNAHRLEVLNAFTAPQPPNDSVLFGVAIRRDDHPIGFPDGLRGAVAIHAFGRLVPGGDRLLQIRTGNGIVGRLDDCPKEGRWIDTRV